MAKRAELRRTGPVSAKADDHAVVALLQVVNGAPRFKIPADEGSRLKAEFAPLVQMAVEAPDDLYRQEFLPRLQELAQGGESLVPGSEVSPSGRLRAMYVRTFRDLHAMLSRALVLVIDEHAGYGRALSRCKLPACQKFYLAKRNPKGGPANRTYCCPAHRDEHHNSYERKKVPATKHK